MFAYSINILEMLGTLFDMLETSLGMLKTPWNLIETTSFLKFYVLDGGQQI